MALDIWEDLRHRALTATPVYCPKAESFLPNLQGINHRNINQVPLFLPKGLQDLPQHTFLHQYWEQFSTQIILQLQKVCIISPPAFVGKVWKWLSYEKKKTLQPLPLQWIRSHLFLLHNIYNSYAAPLKIGKESLGSLLAIPHYAWLIIDY